MQIKKTLLFAFTFCIHQAFGQCPTAGFTLPAAVCVNDSFNVTDNSSGATSYYYDFCPGDLKAIPTATNNSSITGLSTASQVKIVNDNGNYFAFIGNFNGQVTRVDFGSSLDNPSPSVFSYTGFIFPVAVDVIKDGSVWYALIADDGNGLVTRLDLGTAISNNMSTSTTLGSFGLSNPKYIKIARDSGNYFAFVSNFGGSSIIKLEFGNSMANPVSNSSAITHASFSQNWGLEIIHDCANDRFIGFSTNYGSGVISVLDFGNSLSNAPASIQTISTPFAGLAGMQVLHDAARWYLMYVNLSSSALVQLDLGTDLLNLFPTTVNSITSGGISGPRGVNFVNDSSRFFGIVSNSASNTITLIKFINNCDANFPVSSDPSPTNLSYSSSGKKYIQQTIVNSIDNTDYFLDSIVISNPPVADFTFSVACNGQPVNFSDSSTGNIVQWQWDFGDGNSSNLQNPVHVYQSGGTYFVSLTVTAGGGCSDTFSDSIIINENPSAGFIHSTSLCSLSPIQYTDTSIAPSGGSIAAWKWSFGNGDTSVLQNPVYNYPASGNFTVQLIAYSNTGCSDTASQNLNIVTGAHADFTVTGTCAGELTQFNNSSTGATSYLWDFGDSNISNLVNPTHNYPGLPFTYTVKLIAVNANMCNDTIEKEIRISEKAQPSFLYAPNTICAGFPVLFDNTSTIAPGDSIIQISWDFGDASPVAFGSNVQHVYAPAGSYPLQLMVKTKTDCDTVIMQTINVVACPPNPCPVGSVQLPDSVCPNTPVQIINNTILSYSQSWDFCAGDFNNVPSATEVGTYDSLNGARGMDFVNEGGNWYAFVVVINFPDHLLLRFDFGNSPENIPPPPVMITPSLPLDFPWDIKFIKDLNSWYAFVANADGNLYKLKFDSITHITPAAEQYSGMGVTYPGGVTAVMDTSGFKVLAAYYNENVIGIFDFGKFLSNSTPAFSTFPSPLPNVPVSIDAARECDQWYGLITYNSTGVISKIDFGSVISSNIISSGPLITSQSGGLRKIKLVNDGGEWFAFSLGTSNNQLSRIKIGGSLSNPVAVTEQLFSVNGMLPPTYEFGLAKNDSKWYLMIAVSSSKKLISVNFPDNCSANIPVSDNFNPVNLQYADTGKIFIGMSATDQLGNVIYLRDSIYIKPGPNVNFIHTPGCLNSTITFTDLSSISAGFLSSWQWNFGDGTNSTLQHPTHIFSNDSTYNVVLSVTADNGCINSFSQPLTVHELPVADFSFTDSLCSETFIPFTDLSFAPVPEILNEWLWNFDDGFTDSIPSPSHLFDTAGVFNVQLIVTTSNGCSDTITKPITVESSPETDFSVLNTCIGETVQFTNNTLFGISNSYSWDFGDLNSSTAISPSHNYPSVVADYTVQLIANASNGCSDTTNKLIHIGLKADPGFVFIPEIVCQGNQVMFYDTSNVMTGETIVQVAWDFGDGNSAVGDTVFHTYGDTGMYVITAIVKTNTSCDTSISKAISVIPSPVAAFVTNNVCLDSVAVFNASTSVTPPGTVLVDYNWLFGDATGGSGMAVNHLYSSHGTFNVSLTVINNLGCLNTIQIPVTIHPKPVPSFSVLTTPSCANHPLCFNNTTTLATGNVTSFNWDFGDGNSAGIFNPCHTYSNAPSLNMSYNVMLVAVSEFGCRDTLHKSVSVTNSPESDFTASKTCFGESTQFVWVNQGSVPSAISIAWNWNFGNSQGSNLPFPQPVTYNSPGSFTVTLIDSNLYGCTDTTIKTISVNPVPDVQYSTDQEICIGEISDFVNSTTITSGSVTGWLWNFGDGSPIATSENVVHLYSATGTYNVQLIAVSDSGCADTLVKPVSVYELPVPQFTVNPGFGSPPLNVQIVNNSQGATGYLWNFGDGTPLQQGLAPAHTYSDTGVFTITLYATNIFGCVDSIQRNVEIDESYLDLAVIKVQAIKQNGLLSVAAEVANIGSSAATDFDLRVNTNLHFPVIEHWDDSIFIPGKKLNYFFKSSLEYKTGQLPQFFCVEIARVNGRKDDNPSNDRLCGSLSDVYELYNIFPDPAINQFGIAANFPESGAFDFCIFNALGQKVMCQNQIPVKKGYNEFYYPCNQLSAGMYFVRIAFNQNILSARFVKL